jgi:hypothetical protein
MTDEYFQPIFWNEEYKLEKRIKVKPGPRIPRKKKKLMKKLGEWMFTGKVNFTMEFYSTHEDWLSELTEEERIEYYNTMCKKGESSL